MSQLFSRYSNLIARTSLLGVSILIAGNLILWTAWKWSSWETEVGTVVDQPVPFSHQHHVSGLGIDCRYCHTSVTRSASAGLPPTHTCMTCHSQIWQDSPMLKPVRESFAQNRPLQWNRVYRLPKFVYFDHSIHVNKGIGCTSCHGPVGEMPMMRKARSFMMRDCLSCHREPERFLRPQDRLFDSPWNDPWSPPKNQLELGIKRVRAHQIPKRRIQDCNTCHR